MQTCVTSAGPVPGAPRIAGLTVRELEVARLIADGYTNAGVGRALGLTENVVKNYVRDVFDKTGQWSRLELALWYWRNIGVDEHEPVLVGLA